MYIAMALMFVLGYLAIALEHPIKVDKAASALLTAVVLWVLLVIGKEVILSGHTGQETVEGFLESELMHHLSEIASILFFLLGAMTIVEMIDAHGGFEIITDRVSTRSQARLMWILSIVTYFMSAALDNLTTAIVMSTLLRKLIKDPKDIWFFAGLVVIAANAGGAWSPIGDVTTIMLWIGGQITALNIVLKLFIPSLICLLVPLFVMASQRKGQLERPEKLTELENEHSVNDLQRRIVFFMGVGALLFVPIFKTITHLPPFMGILLGVGVLWVTTELMHRKMDSSTRKPLSIAGVLQRVDTPSILFFLGILLAVAALETAGHLGQMAVALDKSIGNIWVINTLIGLLSAIVDNVPLVAGTMGMYSLTEYPTDHNFWELLAYCAGTGGSVLIIGSAAGVATMGILKIDFIWYLKKVSLWALLGYFSGILVFYAMQMLLH